MSKHTPGPWTVFITPSGHQYIEHVPSGRRVEGSFFVAEAMMLSPGAPNAKADACLIAAAPEMYGLLREVAGFLRCVGTDENNDTCGVTFTCGACRRAKEIRLVIAKAEGRS